MQQMMMGSDPEHFILRDGKVVAAHESGLPPSTQRWSLSGGSAYRDGFALELSPYADECRAMFSNSLMALYSEVLMRLNGNMDEGVFYNTPKEKLPISLSMDPLHAFGEEDFRALMETAPPDLKQFGCSPAYDAYEGGKPIRVRVHPAEWPFRTTGGHMHYSLYNKSLYTTQVVNGMPEGLVDAVAKGQDVLARKLLSPLVTKLDACIGLAYTALFPQERGMQKLRRSVYGKAGEFRLQIYKRNAAGVPVTWGVEYRTLGPRLMLSSLTVGLFYGLMRQVCEGGVDFTLLTPEKEKQVRECMQEADASGALSLWCELFPGGVVDGLYSGMYSADTHLILTPEILKGLVEGKLEKLHAHTLPWEQCDAHTGWGEWLKREGFKSVIHVEPPQQCIYCGGTEGTWEGGNFIEGERRLFNEEWERATWHEECFRIRLIQQPLRTREVA